MDSLVKNLRGIDELSILPLPGSAVEKQIRGLGLSKVKIGYRLYLSLSHITVVKAVPCGRVLLQVPCVRNVVPSFSFVSDVDYEGVKLVVLIMQVLARQYLAEVYRELKVQSFLYLLPNA